MSAQAKPVQFETYVLDFSTIPLAPQEADPEIVKISESDGFVINTSFSQDFRIRKTVYEMMIAAQKNLPAGYKFMLYEAYRPLSRQVALWNYMTDKIRKEYPHASDKEIHDMAETFTADPHNGIGSAHQAACAIDITLCDASGKELDMGTKMHEFNEYTVTKAEGIGAEVVKNRRILVTALEEAGLINYPAEWWHYSYGDHWWAYLAGKTEALYGPIDI